MLLLAAPGSADTGARTGAARFHEALAGGQGEPEDDGSATRRWPHPGGRRAPGIGPKLRAGGICPLSFREAALALVTISSAYGALGSEVGHAVAAELDVPFLDRAIPAEVAEQLAVPLAELSLIHI